MYILKNANEMRFNENQSKWANRKIGDVAYRPSTAVIGSVHENNS